MSRSLQLKPELKIKEEDPKKTYEFSDILGEGAYGSVWKGTHIKSGKVYAIKELKIEQRSDMVDIIREIEHMVALGHSDYIVGYECGFVSPKHDKLWIVMEFCGPGSVNDLMTIVQETLSEKQMALICRDALRGIRYLHEEKRIHRDIKAGNILLNDDGDAKLADFGVSSNQKDFTKHHTVIGTPFWMAPEVIQEKYDHRADIWSLGITCIEMAEGRPPHYNVHPMRAIFMIPTRPPPKFTNPELWSTAFNDFLTQCLQKNPNDRPSASKLLKHPWIVATKKLNRKKTLRPLIEAAAAKVIEVGDRAIALGLGMDNDDEEESIEASSSDESSKSEDGRPGAYSTGTAQFGGGYGTTQFDSGTAQFSSGTAQFSSGTAQFSSGTAQFTDSSVAGETADGVFVPQFAALLGETSYGDKDRTLVKPNSASGAHLIRMSVEELNKLFVTLDENLATDITKLKQRYQTDIEILTELQK
eukprot:TRINITY_DN1692_c0_g1_i1.p1 TRINITY_DN1692_c0_g1~~TRINITY_DN1692_c0_g1_i1.p1  ORF type:complete len:498 (+),score=100.42 TRINITY_DN1692_c0_g1_i1:78-1496(+)